MSHMSVWERWWINFWPHRWHVRWHVPAFLAKAPEAVRGQVLEVGCGSGWTSRRILEAFPQVELTATDIDAVAMQQLASAESYYGRRLKVRQADVRQLPFDRNHFDMVLAFGVLYALVPEDVAKAIRELIRVTRPGGLIGISEYRVHLMATDVTQRLEHVWMEEGCEVLYDEESGSYDVWVRKAYE